MKLYLARHGEAVQELQDPTQPLSPAGRAAVEKVAVHLAATRALAGLAEARHSGKLRAVQTAEILCARARPGVLPLAAPGITPMDPPAAALELIAQAAGDLMIVGHMPHLGRLLSQLLMRDPERSLARFPAGVVVCLSRAASGAWTIEWVLPPDLADLSDSAANPPL